jgi:hypothetical protein
MIPKRSGKRIVIGSLGLSLLLSISLFTALNPISAYSFPCPKMHIGFGLKPHPMSTSFRGESIDEERGIGIGPPQAVTIHVPMNGATFLAAHPINLIPMLGFGVGFILLTLFGVRQRQGV